jgi:hypothetical protein
MRPTEPAAIHAPAIAATAARTGRAAEGEAAADGPGDTLVTSGTIGIPANLIRPAAEAKGKRII